VRYKQGNYVKGNFAIFGAVTAFLAANPAFAADAILDGPAPNPCLESPDYVPGVDAAGQPVARADIGSEHTAVPDQIYVPLPNRAGRGRGGRGGAQPGENGPYAAIDGKRLNSLINPPACPAPAPAPTRRR
jgi:hypothetical protein